MRWCAEALRRWQGSSPPDILFITVIIPLLHRFSLRLLIRFVYCRSLPPMVIVSVPSLALSFLLLFAVYIYMYLYGSGIFFFHGTIETTTTKKKNPKLSITSDAKTKKTK